MADEKKSGKAQAFLLAHFEKLVLGVAIAALIGWLALSITSSNPVLDQAKKTLDKVQVAVNAPPPPPPVGPDAPIDFGEKSKSTWGTLGSPHETDDWLVSYPTTFEPKKKVVDYRIQYNQVEIPILLGVSLQEPKASLEGVSLAWDTDTPPPPKKVTLSKTKGEERTYVDGGVDHYVLERKEKDSEKWEKHTEIPGDISSFRDEKIDPVTEYEYRITPVTANEAIREKTGKVSNVVAIKTLNVYDLKVLNVSMGKVFLRVTKHVIGVGPVDKTFNYSPKDLIGSDPKTKETTFTVRGAGKVDFNTGYVVISIKEEKIELERMVCNRVINNRGEQTDCNRKKETRGFTVNVLTYRDAKGKEHRLLDREPEFPDAFNKCILHTPKPVEVVVEGGADGEQKDPKTQEELAAALLTEARKLLDSGKPKEAKAAFQRLLNEFAGTTTVKRNTREIEQRVKEL